LGGAPRLAEVVAQRPHVLDAAIDPGRVAAIADSLDQARMAARVEAYLASAKSVEDTLDRARDFAAEEMFLIGVRLFSGALDPERAGQAYSALAEALLEALLTRVAAAFARDHGKVDGGRVAVLAMGKLGSREMTAASDLDLIVIYDFPADAGDSDGARPLAAGLYYARLTQRLLTALTAPTKAGKLYEVDLRLRPSGRKGPLATQLSAFRLYQANDAETWEHMALTRARVVAGDRRLGDEIAATIAAALTKPRDKAALAKEVTAMRDLIAREKGDQDPWDLKLVSGGLIDVEFVAQYLTLAEARRVPALLDASTRATLAAAAETGVIARDDAEALIAAHRLYTDLTQVMRVAVAGPFDPTTAASGVKRRIAAAAALPDFESLQGAVGEARAAVRRAYAHALGRH
jgi:glutamate-ammonia-ligase adenylyltransferase